MKFMKVLGAAALAGALAAPVAADEAAAPKMDKDDVIVSTRDLEGSGIIVPLILFYMLVMALSGPVSEAPPPAA